MGRSSRLAIGAIAAAVGAGQVAPSHLGAAISLGLAAILLVHEVRPSLRAGTLIPVAIGAALIAIRLAVTPTASILLDTPPDGSGPWALMVETTGSPHDGQQVATLVTLPGDDRPFHVAATLPRYPEVIPGDRVVVEGSVRPRPDSPYGQYLERIGAVGTHRLANPDRPDGSRRSCPPPRVAPPGRGRRPDPGPARARGGPGRRHPHRSARPGRPGPRRGLHDGRRQPCGRDLGLEHRDRRRRDRGHDRSARPSSPVDRDHRCDRRLRGVRRCVGVGRSGGPHGRRCPARARDRPGRTGCGRPRLGGRSPSRLRPGTHR